MPNFIDRQTIALVKDARIFVPHHTNLRSMRIACELFEDKKPLTKASDAEVEDARELLYVMRELAPDTP